MGRFAFPEILKLMLRVEQHFATDPLPDTQWGGIALDASKCFDRIQWTSLWNLLETHSVPSPVIAALSGFYLQHQRHTVIRGLYDPTSWATHAGVLHCQGCALSVACTVALVATWHARTSMAHQISYIDNCMLTSETHESLLRAWSCSQLYGIMIMDGEPTS